MFLVPSFDAALGELAVSLHQMRVRIRLLANGGEGSGDAVFWTGWLYPAPILNH
jgi:hypothetical protein